MAVPKVDDFYSVDEFLKATKDLQESFELLDGKIVAMGSPSTTHQRIVKRLTLAIDNYIIANKGKCEVFQSPFDVRLDDYNMVIPDVFVVCDPSKIDDKRCNGSPDWIIEVVSSNWKDDYVRKLSLYEKFGVREYWIVDPQEQRTIVYFFEDRKIVYMYDFSKNIPVNIYRDKPIKLELNVLKLLEA